MKKAICLAYIHVLFCIMWNGNVLSQCPGTGPAWMERITAIEGSDSPLSERIKAMEELLAIHKRCEKNRDSILARIVHRLGDLYRQTGDIEEGILYARQAVAINSAPDPRTQKSFLTHSYYNLGLYYDQLYLFPESNNYFDSCIAIGSKYPQKIFIVLMAYEQKAFSFYKTADYQKSIETANKGILLAQQVKDTLFEAIIQMQKAQSELALNRIAEAEKNILQVIHTLTRTDMPAERLATGYSIYAKLLNTKKEPHAAAAYYKNAFKLNLQQKNLSQCARDLLDLGYVYDKDLNDAAKAIASYVQGLKLAQQVNDAYLVAGLYNNMGVVHWRKKDYRGALQFYQKGLTALPLGFKDSSIAGNPTAAMLRFNGNDYFVYTLLSNKAEALLHLYKKTKKNELLTYALNSFGVADKMVDQMRWKQYSEQSKLFWRVKTKKLYENAIETCYLLNTPEDAFFFFEKSRAVLLNDKLNELGANQYLPASEITAERALRTRLLSLQQQLSNLPENTTAYNSTRHQLYSAQDMLEDFIKALEKNYPAYYQYKYDTTIHTVNDVRAGLLKNQQSLVEYFSGDSAIYILAVTPERSILRQVNFADYTQTARELFTLVSDKSLLNRHYPRYRSLAYRLYDSLFRKLAIPTARVIISPDDYFIPFELLITDTSVTNSFLLHKHAFSYTYSANFLMKQDERPFYSELLGIAPVTYQPHLKQQPLAGADRSLKNISGLFSSATILTDGRATKKQFLGRLSAYPVVHLYSHANADSTEKEPVLYFSDSMLHLTELQALGDLRTKLVVLSACNTGMGKNIKGEGIFSLSRGFAAAGIPATVTNLWQIDNQATYQLTELFYKYLNEGLPGDKALQKAKLDFLSQNEGEHELPYFWAASLFMGKAEVIQRKKVENKNTWYLIGGGILILLLGLGYAVYTKRKK